MQQDVDEILKQALALPPEDRAAIAEVLLAGIEDTVNSDVEAAWEDEVARRLKEIDEGRVELVPWAEPRRLIAGT